MAEVRSVSAVGEQYVDLRPRTDSGPFLEDGSRIPASDTTIPQPVGPMPDQLSALVDSLPKDRIPDLLDETFKAFNGAGPDFGSLLNSASKLTEEVNAVSDETRRFIDDTGPLLDSQAETTDAIRTWARSPNGVTEQLVQNDPSSAPFCSKDPASSSTRSSHTKPGSCSGGVVGPGRPTTTMDQSSGLASMMSSTQGAGLRAGDDDARRQHADRGGHGDWKRLAEQHFQI